MGRYTADATVLPGEEGSGGDGEYCHATECIEEWNCGIKPGGAKIIKATLACWGNDSKGVARDPHEIVVACAKPVRDILGVFTDASIGDALMLITITAATSCDGEAMHTRALTRVFANAHHVLQCQCYFSSD